MPGVCGPVTYTCRAIEYAQPIRVIGGTTDLCEASIGLVRALCDVVGLDWGNRAAGLVGVVHGAHPGTSERWVEMVGECAQPCIHQSTVDDDMRSPPLQLICPAMACHMRAMHSHGTCRRRAMSSRARLRNSLTASLTTAGCFASPCNSLSRLAAVAWGTRGQRADHTARAQLSRSAFQSALRLVADGVGGA